MAWLCRGPDICFGVALGASESGTTSHGPEGGTSTAAVWPEGEARASLIVAAIGASGACNVEDGTIWDVVAAMGGVIGASTSTVWPCNEARARSLLVVAANAEDGHV